MPNKPPAAAASGARPVGIFMLGMHRSGTSVLTRILNLLGCSLPADLLGANASNPSGHWESSRAIEINDALLAAFGRRWDDVRELPEGWMQRPETEAAKQQIRALIDWEFSGKGLWLLKEPRMCRLAPLWLEVAQEMGIDTRVILPIRHPSEVSYSLTRRDGIAAGRTQLLWCRHVLEAEHASRAVPRVLVDFGALTADWRSQVERIATALGLEWPNQSSEVFSQIDAFIDPDLRHADASGRREQLTERVPLAAPIARLYKEMLKADGDGVWEVIARASDSIARNGSLFAPVIDDLAEQVERKQARAAAMNAILANKLTEGGAWLLNENDIQTLLGDTRAILDRVDENGPITVELIRQIETQRQEIRANASLISEGNSQLFQKIDQTGPLLAEVASQVEAQRRELFERQDPLLVELVRQIEVQRSELGEVGKLFAAESQGIRAGIEQASPMMVELIRQVQDQRAAIDAMRRSFAAQQRASLSSEMHEQDRIVYAETEAALRLQLELSQAQLDARQEELEFLRSRLKFVGREHAQELSEKTARIDELLNSRSWKLTAPIRWASRRFRSGPRAEPQTSPDKDGLLRSIYLAVPLSWSTRLRIKSAAFKLLGPMIGNTDAYRRWQSQQRPPPQLLESDQPPRRAPDEAGERVGLRSAYTEPKYVPIAPDSVAMEELRAKLIAFYLPQFHPIPENDEWWGRGFTEWTNVSKAVPQFKGHGVPHLPGELGFYDLRLPEVMQRQIELARQYGVHGFCFHYYWFDGRRILERPLDQFLGNPEFDFPFCICWANENWTRRWDGHDDDVLLGQSHSPDSDLRFIQDADPILRDPRYIRVDGRPLLIVYRPSLLPDCASTVARWRQYCREAGIGEIMLAMVQFDVEDPRPFGFDVALEFPPHKLARNLPSINATLESLNPEFRGYVVDYQAVVNRSVNWPVPEYDMIRGVFPGWDNEARKPQQGYLFANSSPERYRDWLRHAVDYARGHRVHGEALVFVNAWNEWAEGAYLEPDRRYGYAYLQATRDALTAQPRDGGDENVRVTSADRPRALPAPASGRRVVVVSHDAHPHGAQYLSLHLCREIARVLGCPVDVVLLGDGVLEADFQQAATVHSLPCRGGTAAGLELARKLRAGGADVAIANTTVSGLFASDLSAAGFKLVSLVHEMPGVIESYGLRPHAQRIARDADLVVFAADAVREGFEQFATLDPARTLIRTQGNYKHNRHQSAASIAAARSELRRRLGIGEDALVVLSVGYADLRKGVDLFVSVGAKLIRQDPRVHMLWLGHLDLGLEPELRAQIRATGLERHFHFPGRDSDTDVYYAGSDLYALTSREDPFPTVIMEAFDVGVPVVGFTSAGGFEELLGRAGGRLAPAFDVDAYALECSKLLADDALRQALGREGKAVVESEFSFTDYVHDLLGYLGVQVPRVSVVVPNYNYARYLPERLRSIAGQTLPPYEIIVLDDASSDDSLAVLGELAGSIPLRVIINENNSGSVFRQWQKGVAAARGEYVWIAEADDLSAPEFLRTVTAAFQLPGVVMSYCQSRQIDEHGKELSPDYLDYVADFGAERWRAPFIADLSEELDHGLAVKNTIPNVSAVVFRRAELAAVLAERSDEISEFRIAGDWLAYMHVLAAGTVAFNPAALNLHRRHAGGVTIGADHRPHLEEVLRVQRWVADRFELEDRTVDAAARYIEFLKVYFGLEPSRT